MRLRISGPARDDLRQILAASRRGWGLDGAARYEATIVAALHRLVAAPMGPSTKDQGELSPGLRALRLHRLRGVHGVRSPVHVIYFRVQDETVLVVRVLHERMDPVRHLRATPPRRRTPTPR